MRLLVISNFYPPHSIGGYELVCAQVVDWLASRGHTLLVLTQRGLPSAHSASVTVRRELYWLPVSAMATKRRFAAQLPSALRHSLKNRSKVAAACRTFAPDLVLVFSPAGLGWFLTAWLHQQARVPVIHDVSDLWLLRGASEDYWAILSTLRFRGIKEAARKGVMALGGLLLPATTQHLKLGDSYFRSQFLKREFIRGGVEGSATAPVIYHGIAARERGEPRPTRRDGILFAGRLERHKGLHVLLKALPLIDPRAGATVTVAGTGANAQYETEIRELMERVPSRFPVELVGQIEINLLRQMVDECAIFAFPVTWDEPFSLTLLEAMQAGAAIAATATGGSAEILTDRRNCLIVARESPDGLAAALSELLLDVRLREEIGRCAQATVAGFKVEASLGAIEQHLEAILRRRRAASG